MRINYRCSDIKKLSIYKNNQLSITEADNEYTYNISIGETLFIKIVDSEVTDMLYHYDEYLQEEADLAKIFLEIIIK